jgi:hypothetical protein
MDGSMKISVSPFANGDGVSAVINESFDISVYYRYQASGDEKSGYQESEFRYP